jgi:hypothetical protein
MKIPIFVLRSFFVPPKKLQNLSYRQAKFCKNCFFVLIASYRSQFNAPSSLPCLLNLGWKWQACWVNHRLRKEQQQLLLQKVILTSTSNFLPAASSFSIFLYKAVKKRVAFLVAVNRVARWYIFKPNKKYWFGLILVGLAMEDVGILYSHGVLIMAMWYIFPYWQVVPTKIWQPLL